MRPDTIVKWLRSPAAARLLASCAAFAFYFAALATGRYLPDRDAYFHIRIALEILDRGFVAAVPQMAHAIHAERYVDFHFLFHYALVPFVAIFDDPLLAARVATAAFAALAVASLDLVLAGMRVRHRWFWLLGFVLFSPIFTGRLLFGRGVTLLLALLFYFALCLLRRRFRRGGVVAALAVWTYPGFPVLLGFAGLCWLASACRGRFRPAPLLWPAAGVLFALIVHPAFPYQFYGYYLEFVVHSVGAADLERIAEWLPPSRELLLLGLSVPVAIFMATVLGGGRHDSIGSALLVAALFFVLLSAISLKPFEYVLAFLILYCARQTRGVFVARVYSSKRHENPRMARALVEALYVVTAAALLLWSMPQIFSRMQQQYRMQDPSAHFAAADWLRENASISEISGARASDAAPIALAWDNFPEFYYRNPGHLYYFGLNPVYSYGADVERYRVTRRLFSQRGYAHHAGAFNPADDLLNLGARYAVFERRRNAHVLAALLAPSAPGAASSRNDNDDRKFEAVYQNPRFIIVRAKR